MHIQDVSIRQLNMQGWTKEVGTAVVNLAVSAGRKCEVEALAKNERERERGLGSEPRGTGTFQPQTKGAQDKESGKERRDWEVKQEYGFASQARGAAGRDVARREDLEVRTDKWLLFLVVSCWSRWPVSQNSYPHVK